MSSSALLTIIGLVIACAIVLYTLATEKPEKEHSKYRKPILYVMTALAMILGGWQVYSSDKKVVKLTDKTTTKSPIFKLLWRLLQQRMRRNISAIRTN